MTYYLFEGIYVISHHSLVFPRSPITTVFLERREYFSSPKGAGGLGHALASDRHAWTAMHPRLRGTGAGEATPGWYCPQAPRQSAVRGALHCHLPPVPGFRRPCCCAVPREECMRFFGKDPSPNSRASRPRPWGSSSLATTGLHNSAATPRRPIQPIRKR